MQTRSLDPRALLDAPPQDAFALLELRLDWPAELDVYVTLAALRREVDGHHGDLGAAAEGRRRRAVAQRSLPLRKRQEVQALPRRLT